MTFSVSPVSITGMVEITVFSPMRGLFSYLWPASLGEPEPGLRVRIPFGRSVRSGLVVAVGSGGEKREGLKEVLDRLDAHPLYSAARLRWLERAARYYAAAPGEMGETAMAWAANDDKRRWSVLDAASLNESDGELAGAFGRRGVLSAGSLRRKLPREGFYYRLSQAVGNNLLEEVTQKNTDPEAENKAGSEAIPEQLNAAQQKALDAILRAQGFAPFLLFGCTGSGKTEVYLRAAAERITKGGKVLILVPEIGLTPQWLARLHARFARVAVWHSGLSDIEKLAMRRELPEAEVLVGTRSALFLPLPDLAMIVVDEEHDTSFKQQEGVHYHARDLAVLLAQECAIPIVMGSATPAMESWQRASEGRYGLLELPERISPHPTPVIEQVDMRGVDTPLSDTLLKALAGVKAQGRQSLLYLNRRGYAPALMCAACGDVPQCPACSLRLTLHRKHRQLRCHACGFLRPVPQVCEACGEDALLPMGEGTEKVEDQLQASLPEFRIARLDRDTVRGAGQLRKRLDDFAAGRLDCLIGTQMLVKGHHFPNVTLVGVVNADLGLSMPDFRAGERWWQQLTQVIGRTGRGEHAGRVLVQTRNPGAVWLSRIGDEQARQTLTEELALRQALQYPPFARWVRLIVSAVRVEAARAAGEMLAAGCRRLPEAVLCAGPMSCAIERLAGRYRFELVLRDASGKHLPWMLAPLLAGLKLPSTVRLKVDVDPLDMM